MNEREPEETPTRIVLAVCTHRRNDELRRLLRAFERSRDAAASAGRRVQLGVAIADDNDDGRAEPIVAEFEDRFDLGIEYRHTASGNISIARNASLEASLDRADFVAMTDDDCEPVDGWVSAYLDVLEATGADIVTGPTELTAPPGAPDWLSEQPFYGLGDFDFEDRDVLDTAATNNSMFRAAFFADRPDLRFLPELGEVGGEDMVFFRSALREGAEIRFAGEAKVLGHESDDRATYPAQLRAFFWHGNTEFVTNRTLGEASRPRWAARSVKIGLEGAARPFARLARRESPQWRYASAVLARAAGMLAGALGVRLRHH